MLGLIVFSVIAAAYAATLAHSSEKPKPGVIWTTMAALSMAATAFIVYVGVVTPMVLTFVGQQSYRPYGKLPLKAVQGKKMLMTDLVNGKKYYVFYYETAPGRQKLGEVKAELATVHEDQADGGYGYMDSIKVVNVYGRWTWFIVPRFMYEGSILAKPLLAYYSIHVPVGTIGTVH
ncbi:hypothetical protein M1432_02260 [Patescibacteria group bacterium]|nr:hypothetical protein [Patescibacteria group bacterium]